MNKKILIPLFFCLAGCYQATLPVEIPPHELQVFRVGAPATKTVVHDGSAVWWQAGDEISFYAGTGCEGVRFQTAISESSPEADFSGYGAVKLSDKYLAVYPKENEEGFNAYFTGLNIAQKQTCVQNSFDPEATPLYAFESSTDMTFKHVAAFIKFTVGPSTPDFVSLEIADKAGAKLTGAFRLWQDDGSVSVSESLPSYANVSITTPDGTSFKQGSYYIAICPGLHPEGISMTFKNSVGAEAILSFDESADLESGDVKDLGTLPPLSFHQATDIKVMYFNIRVDGKAEDEPFHSWDSRKAAILAMINEQSPDVLCLNECKYSQLQYLQENLDAYSLMDWSYGNQNYIFFKKAELEPVPGSEGKFWLSPTPEEESLGWSGYSTTIRNCIYTRFKIKSNSEHFWVFCTHSSHQSTMDAYLGHELIAQRINTIVCDDEPAFLGGDLNSATDSESLMPLRRVMTCAREASPISDDNPSYNDWGEWFSTPDNIFVSGKMRLVEFKTVNSPYSGVQYISDHYPVMLRCSLPTSTSLNIVTPTHFLSDYSGNVKINRSFTSGEVGFYPVNIDGKVYTLAKLGSASQSGSLEMQMPRSGDFNFSFFAFSWERSSCEITLSITGGGTIDGAESVTIQPRAHGEASGYSPFYLNPTAKDQYSFNIKGAVPGTRLSISTSLPEKLPEYHKADYRTIVLGCICDGGTVIPEDDSDGGIDPLTPNDDWNVFTF